jgi:oxygen-independent coproporphyrinogen-3 oxidase
MNPTPAACFPSLPPHALMCRFESDAPACTAYPAPNRFVEAIGADDVGRALRLRASRAIVGRVAPLAIRLNIPFCARPSETCSCRPVVTRRHVCVARYLRALRDEVALVVREAESARTVSRIHVGGAVPLFLSDDELAQVLSLLRASFRVADDAVTSIEAAASLCTPSRIEALCAAGFNRLFVALDDMRSGGTDGAGLKDAVEAAGPIGSAGVTVDIQSAAADQAPLDFARAVAEVAALRPARIRITRVQARPRPSTVRGGAMPLTASAIERMARLRDAIERLLCAGYVHVGLDEFAVPADSLAAASRHGRLHLGVRGFGTRPEGEVLALGVSAIGRVGAVAYQNVDLLADYYAALQGERLPVARGLVLDRGDLARESVIQGLLSQGRVAFEAISLSHLIDMRAAFSREFALLDPLVQAGLVDVDDEALELTAMGRWFAPVVAAVFDRELQRDALRVRLSRGDAS